MSTTAELSDPICGMELDLDRDDSAAAQTSGSRNPIASWDPGHGVEAAVAGRTVLLGAVLRRAEEGSAS